VYSRVPVYVNPGRGLSIIAWMYPGPPGPVHPDADQLFTWGSHDYRLGVPVAMTRMRPASASGKLIA
jgi:hypothetical protein